MYTTEILLFCLACFASMASCKPTAAEATSTSQLGAPCHVDNQDVQQVAPREDTLATVEHIMCGKESTGLITELLGLSFDANMIKSKIVNTLVHSNHLMRYITNIEISDTPSMTCVNLTDYIVSIYEEMITLTKSLDEIEKSSACSENLIFHMLKGDLTQLSLKADQTMCSMATNGLYRIADISNISIGTPAFISVCADPSVNHVPATDVLRMIYKLTVLLEQSTIKAYGDISSVCNDRNCIEERDEPTNYQTAEIIG